VQGRIYVAPPDNHMVVRAGYVHVLRGPKENNQRPSADVLFRSASVTYGPAVVGVVLSGLLDCGTSGLLSIKARNGLAVAQNPREAPEPSMPQSALNHVQVDHIAPAQDIGLLISRLAREPAEAWPAAVPRAIEELEGKELGAPPAFVCPLCQGRQTETELYGYQSFRCHVGHAFSLQSIAAEQADALERALWAAVRALEESSAVARRLASSAGENLRKRFEEKGEARTEHAETIRRILLDTRQPSVTDAAELAAKPKR
jgi:two-component system chemotaxis response regulator CheB